LRGFPPRASDAGVLPEEHKVDELGQIRGVVNSIREIHRSWRLSGEGSRRDISGVPARRAKCEGQDNVSVNDKDDSKDKEKEKGKDRDTDRDKDVHAAGHIEDGTGACLAGSRMPIAKIGMGSRGVLPGRWWVPRR
jgi:hypothetical protein